tara:strand:- start:3956 stop:5206 length:1251 start_codon:yes stop_codon:yes gene_type:complete
MKVFAARQSISIGWIDIFKSICRIPFKSTSGNDVKRWEKKNAKFVKVPYAVSFISERAGTYFTLKLLKEMNKWDKPEIICPSYTFFSIPWAAQLAGWELRFADILNTDLNLDPESLERQINDNTKAVIVTHLNGKPAKILEIARICKKNNIRLFEDCAHAIGLKVDDKPVGSWDIGCFSFGDGKSLGTFSGGIITTSDSKLFEELGNLTSKFSEQSMLQISKKILTTFMLKILTANMFYPIFLYPLLRWFGYMSADSRKKDFLNFIDNTTADDLAFKFSDVQALVGLAQLDALEKRNEIRRTNSSVLRRKLSPKAIVKLLPWNGKEDHTMLHDALLLDSGKDIVKKSLQIGIDMQLDYCGNCRNLPGMENFMGEDKIGRSLDGKVFFIPNHLGITSILAEKIAIALDKLILDSDAS